MKNVMIQVGEQKKQVPNCLGICLDHLWEMII